MPYARLMQAASVAIEEMVRVEKQQMVNAAFIGYQTAAAQGALKKGMTFARYLTQLGLHAKPDSATIRAEREAAKATAARVTELFNRGNVRKETE
jgi:predicted alpha-1,6-mannanase (GH76 family)